MFSAKVIYIIQAVPSVFDSGGVIPYGRRVQGYIAHKNRPLPLRTAIGAQT